MVPAEAQLTSPTDRTGPIFAGGVIGAGILSVVLTVALHDSLPGHPWQNVFFACFFTRLAVRTALLGWRFATVWMGLASATWFVLAAYLSWQYGTTAILALALATSVLGSFLARWRKRRQPEAR